MGSETLQRKRVSSTEGDEPPRKKVAFEGSSVKEISILQESEEWSPIIATSAGLTLSKSFKFNAYQRPRKLLQRSRPRSHSSFPSNELLLHSSSHPCMDHVVQEEELAGSDSTLKHYVGVFDPKTGKLEVIRARHMVVRASVRQSEEERKKAEEEIEQNVRYICHIKPLEEDFHGTNLCICKARSARAALTSAFGTKKSKAAIAAMTTNAITAPGSSDSGPPSALSKAILSSMPTKVPTKESRAADLDALRPIPAYNASTSDPKEVYPIASILPQVIATLIPTKDWVSLVASKTEIETPSRFVSRRIIEVVEGGDTTQIKLLRYIAILIAFHNALKGGTHQGASLKKRLPNPEALNRTLQPYISDPTPILHILKNTFAPPSQTPGMLSPQSYILLVTTILVCTLYLDEFVTLTSDITEDLHLTTKDTNHYYAEVGCKVNSPLESERQRWGLGKTEARVRRVARLKAPVDFPKASRGRRTR
ncbi:MAG: DNA-directed RNA polymerase I subunit rpa49 [Cirrosporium novae-zelandiae]|nr:MAG: DNA-directed RNA polymerase I subunit rpa49 [Cirrosporium novae-zelandiae]